MPRRGLFCALTGAVCLATGVFGSSARATVLYSEDFDSDHTANWTFASSIASDTANNNSGGEANVFFDYGTAAGIPTAPHSVGGSTRGMKMESNVPGTALFSGMSMSPNGTSITGNFTMTWDSWQNANGPFPGGGSGSTQMTMGGYGSNGTTVQFPGGPITNTVYFGGTAEGGSSNDYRSYLGNGGFTGTPPTLTVASGSLQPEAQKNPDGTPVYAAGAATGSTNNSNAYYASLGTNTPPAAQTALFAQQTGATAVGTLGMVWRQWEVQKIGTIITWKVDGKLISTIDTNMNPAFAFDGSDIFFGQFDINATSSTDSNARALLFGLVDNIVVTDQVPEPASILLLSLGAVTTVMRRKRRAI